LTEIGKYPLYEWEMMWQPIGILDKVNLSSFNKSVGLYRAKLGSDVVYLGRAVEYNNGGLRKRLSDYRRASDSSRKHKSGQKMYDHRRKLQIEIIVTGNDIEGAEIAKELEKEMIKLHAPEWNDRML